MRQLISFIFSFGTILLVSLTLISFSDYQSQTFDIFDHLRLHYIICAGFAFFIFLWLRKTTWLVLALLVLLLNGSILYSSYLLTLGETEEKHAAKVVKLLNFNAYYKNKNAKKFIELVHQEKPDVIVLEEFRGITLETVFQLKSLYPYSGPVDEITKRPNYIYIFSKLPFELKSFKHREIGDKNPPMIHGELQVGDATIDLIAVHLYKPFNAHIKSDALKWLSNYLKQLTNPVLLVGDFNLTPWSDALLKFSSKNKMKKFGWLERSWPSQTADVYFPFAHLLIDHVFVRDGALWKINKHRFEAGASIGSDHLPMISTFSLEKK